ncbi:MAG: hypothetical protein K6A36_03015 [Paludibacteraceae bacterium]|nr:hypothetical protein [Paludibacteraceae bacterium]
MFLCVRVHSFTRSFVHPFIRSSVHPFIRSPLPIHLSSSGAHRVLIGCSSGAHRMLTMTQP